MSVPVLVPVKKKNSGFVQRFLSLTDTGTGTDTSSVGTDTALILSSRLRRRCFNIFQVDAAFLQCSQDVIQQQREGVDIIVAIQSVKVNDLFADSEREKGFVLFHGISHWGSGICPPADGFIEILAGQLTQRLAQRAHRFRQSRVLFS